jgi:hypothetical protein
LRYQITAEVEYDYVLILNPMTGNLENRQQFGPFPTREALKAFYDAEVVEPYEDQGPDFFSTVGATTKTYRKSFRKGGPLEWMNPLMPSEWEQPGFHHHGVHEVLAQILNVYSKTPLG